MRSHYCPPCEKTQTLYQDVDATIVNPVGSIKCKVRLRIKMNVDAPALSAIRSFNRFEWSMPRNAAKQNECRRNDRCHGKDCQLPKRPADGTTNLTSPQIIDWITATFTGPRRKTCKQKKPRGPRLRVQRIVIPRFVVFEISFEPRIGIRLILANPQFSVHFQMNCRR